MVTSVAGSVALTLKSRLVITLVKANAPNTPVLLLTGWGHQLQGADIPEYVDRVLCKPPRMSELRAALADIAAKASWPAIVDSVPGR